MAKKYRYILDEHLINQNEYLQNIYDNLQEVNENRMELISSFKHVSKGYNEHDLILVSLKGWQKLANDNRSLGLPTTLILKA